MTYTYDEYGNRCTPIYTCSGIVTCGTIDCTPIQYIYDTITDHEKRNRDRDTKQLNFDIHNMIRDHLS